MREFLEAVFSVLFEKRISLLLLLLIVVVAKVVVVVVVVVLVVETFRKPEEGKRQPLETVTRRLVKTMTLRKLVCVCVCACVTVIHKELSRVLLCPINPITNANPVYIHSPTQV
jgi:undecaprenyl pyrophosphate phosphatase UppP